VRAQIAPGYGQADRNVLLLRAVDEMNLPIAYSTALTGKAKEMEKTFTEFLWVFLLSFIFMYMILASQFESMIHPLTILLSLPLSVPFAMLSLWYTGNTLNLYSALGILVLFGVVKKNAILQIDHMNSLRAHGMSREEAIMVGNAPETGMWSDAQVPDRRSTGPEAGGLTSKDGEAEDGQAAGVRAPDAGGA